MFNRFKSFLSELIKVKQWDFAILAADQWEEMTMEPMKMEAQIWITVKTVSKMENLQNLILP